MDRNQILLVGLPIFLFFSDILNLFSPQPPPKPTHHHHLPIHPKPHPQPHLQQPLEFPAQVFSKLKENRFPGEIELRELVGRRLASTRFASGIEGGVVL
ncbi:hypothetical protein JHK85_001502 [Glycine max]|uniref:SelT-like protein n=1 Tax=Glycine soja TaxID=3848 RepID=A0A0B2RNX4_GLYSO|nr:hypothetical protein JHK85_001502 [Glycine max]KAG5088848.1 hypothetical protein JHK86_001460 [Glycine max]KHN34745.1 SelT-like protein [Glycine soja]